MSITPSHKDSLVFWRDLTPFPVPLKAAVPSSPRVLIIGGGIIGLTTAWTLLDRGYHVIIIAKEWASWGMSQRLTSQIAGALWEFPPAVCGQHTDAISLQHSKRWCMIAYHIWDAIAACKELSELSGVRMKGADFFFPTPIEQDMEQMSKMLEIMSSGIRGIRRDPAIIKERNINSNYGAVDAYEHLAPIIDTDRAMAWLTTLVEQKGAKLITTTIIGDLLTQESSLRSKYNADIIINATGLAGTDLADDKSCYPIRSGLLRVINDGSDFPKLDHALTITADAIHDSNEIVFIVPRNDRILLIGGIAEPNKDTLSLTIDSPIIKRMRARCETFFPGFKNARLDSEYPLAQGLRPFRQRNVRVERELRLLPTSSSRSPPQSLPPPPSPGMETKQAPSRIVHTYGQGGAGWSLSFGCAGDVVALVEEALQDLAPRAMAIDTAAVDPPPAVCLPKAKFIKGP